MKSVIRPKKPTGNWVEQPPLPDWATLGYEGSVWLYPEKSIFAISAVEVARDQDDIDRGPEYHLSISKNGRRCSSNEARFVLTAFGMQDAEEDNHVPHGVVRNFWLPVAEKLIGLECPCKETETAFKEDKGDYIWRGIN